MASPYLYELAREIFARAMVSETERHTREGTTSITTTLERVSEFSTAKAHQLAEQAITAATCFEAQWKSYEQGHPTARPDPTT